jgi:hypothetical protein
MDETFNQYYEDLLRAQYNVSESLVSNSHLSCGTIREDFLRDLLSKRRQSLKISKGFVRKGSKQSGECDLIFYDANSAVDTLGNQLFVKPENCKLVIEVKSNATGLDLSKSNDNFKTIKDIDSEIEPMCGLFCYNVDLQRKTILKRFGWEYDGEMEGWNDDIANSVQYESVDFIINIASSLDKETSVDCQFFLNKDNSSGRYILAMETPILGRFLAITDNL